LKNEFKSHEWKGECLEHTCIICEHFITRIFNEIDKKPDDLPCGNCRMINNVTECYFVEKGEKQMNLILNQLSEAGITKILAQPRKNCGNCIHYMQVTLHDGRTHKVCRIDGFHRNVSDIGCSDWKEGVTNHG
jgi:hypothetical protein